MRMIRPRLVAPQVTIAEDQDQYKTMTAAIVRHPLYAAGRVAFDDDTPGLPEGENVIPANSIVVAFQPSEEERAQLAAGEAIYISLLTYNRPMNPIIVSVGAAATAAIYDLEVEA
jgi:hypothetical protein